MNSLTSKPVEVNSNKGDVEVTAEELAVREAKDRAFKIGQDNLLSKMALAWKREESDRMAGWLLLSSMATEFVSAELAHYGSGKNVYSGSCRKLETFLADLTDDAKASVSRLLATNGLYNLMVVETDAEEAKALMGNLTVSILKSLVRLIVRDDSAPTLVYGWKVEALEKGPVLVVEAAEEGMTVVKLRDAVDAVLAPATDAKEEEEGKASAKKQASQKAVGSIDKALAAAGKNGARKEALKRAVKTDALTTEDVVTIASASPDARAAVISTATPDELVAVIRQWATAGRFVNLKTVYDVVKEELGKAMAAKEAKKDKKLVAA